MTNSRKLSFWSKGPLESQFLSNFWPCSVVYEDILFASAEHAYQWAKLEDKSAFVECFSLSASAVKRKSNSFVRRAGWGTMRKSVMRDILACKFSQNPDLLDQLVALHSQGFVLEHEASWDLYWGCHNGEGLNWQGLLTMEVAYNELLKRATAQTQVFNDPSKTGSLGYIGRGSKWGNPERVTGAVPRNEAIRRFCAYLKDSPLIESLADLNAQVYCFCVPEHCHGHILACAKYLKVNNQDPRAWLDMFSQIGFKWEQEEVLQTSLF